jgi:hypothetical protein
MADEGFALGGPVLERPGLKIEVKGLAIGPDGKHADSFPALRRRLRCADLLIPDSLPRLVAQFHLG